MIDLLRRDIARRPELFRWNGALHPRELGVWRASAPLEIPDDLWSMWSEIGGGDLFESETLLAPLVPGHDNIDEHNAHLRQKGLPGDLYVFHVGAFTSAIERERSSLIQVDPTNWSKLGEYRSLSEWYSMLRAEFADRYGL